MLIQFIRTPTLKPITSKINFGKSFITKANESANVNFSAQPQTNTKFIIILLGAPNSGKSTLAKKISNKYSIPHISTGDILRNEVKNGTETGNKVQHFINSGGLVPDELIIDILKSRISMPDCKDGYILDGFPRTVKQAKILEKILKQEKNIKFKVINLDVDKDILYDRLAKRYICQDCQKSYLLDTYDPQKSKCECGGDLIKRTDDTTNVLQKRLENYEHYKTQLLTFYSGKLLNIESHNIQTHEKVLGNILNIIA